MRALTLTMLALGLAACSKDTIEVRPQSDVADYGASELVAAVDTFVKEGRTPAAFSSLATTILALRPTMDRAVGEQAELKLVVLALGPVEALSSKPLAEQVEALALTVWPALLAPPIAYDAILIQRDPTAVELLPRKTETVAKYLERLCGGPLASECKQVVPEHQGAIIAALATRRATERARNAIASCLMCGNESGWHEAIRGWEAQDRMRNGTVHDLERKADPANWPTAGNAAEAPPALPEAEIDSIGAVVIGGQRYQGTDRVEAFRALRGEQAAIALHLRPDLSLAQVKALVLDAKQSGAAKVAVVARLPVYPWERRVYWLSDSGTTRAGLRLTDSLQLLLHTVDHVAGPGAVARVD